MKIDSNIKSKIVKNVIIIVLYFITGVGILIFYGIRNEMSQVILPYSILAISAIACILANSMAKKSKNDEKNNDKE